jgi:hypothetical protein
MISVMFKRKQRYGERPLISSPTIPHNHDTATSCDSTDSDCYWYCSSHLDPPGLAFSTEVCLGPSAEKNLSTFVNIKVGKSKGKGGRSTNNSSGRGVLKDTR